MVASLFLKVPKDLFDAKVKDIYIRAIRDTFGDVPYVVANDGDVSALAGAMSLEENNILGIAMGTSEAVGYVDENGNITGWLNELAFAPVDVSPNAMEDEWSGDIGCGVKYFSQDGVIKLAPAAGISRISLSDDLAPAQKLKEVQKLMENPGSPAEAIFRLQACAAAGPGHVRSGRRHHPGRVQAGAGRRVPRDRGQDQPHPARRKGPPRGPVRGCRLPARAEVSRQAAIPALL